jgi:3-dehydroquinate synthase
VKTVRVNVRLGKRSYPIWIGAGLVKRVGALMKKAKLRARVAVITSAPVARRYLAPLKRSLGHSGFGHVVIEVPDGERAKTLEVAQQCWRKLLREGFDRSSCIVAMGGGTVGDLAGFVASAFLRGVSLVHVPTTLLACVDSAVGGKTGINLPEGKNLVGTFYQPKMVISDVRLLRTLPPRQFSIGLAEVIKYGVIWDDKFFSYLEKHMGPVRQLDIHCLMKIIRRSCEIKAEVVHRDEQDADLRAILNYGHTVGHALEASSSYQGITHGEAVALGMICATRLAIDKRWLKESVLLRQMRLLHAAGLPIHLHRVSVPKALRHITFDKKRRKGKQVFVIPKRIGRVVLEDSFNKKDIQRVLQELVS